MENTEQKQEISFELVDDKNKRVQVIVTDDSIVVKKNNIDRKIKRTALLGCKLYETFNPEYKNKIVVYYIKRTGKKVNIDVFRISESRNILFSNFFSTDLKYLRSLKFKILQLIYKDAPPVSYNCENNMNMYLEENYNEMKKYEKKKKNYTSFSCKEIPKFPRQFFLKTDDKTKSKYYKKVLMAINPNSGTKKAKEIFESRSKIFKANGILYDIYETKFKNDITDYLSKLNLNKLKSYDAIFCFSGDGLVHEVINGIAKREDFDMKENPITIAHFPSGTGCALSENIARFSNTESNVDSVVYAVCHWRTTSLPLFKYKITTHDGTEKIIYGFLSLNLGFFADVDIGSEILRFMGSARFDIYGAFKLMGFGSIPLRVKWTQMKENCLDINSNNDKKEDLQDSNINNELNPIQEEDEMINEESSENSTQEMEKFDLNLSSKIPIEFKNEWNEPEYRGKVFSLLGFTLPFFSRKYLSSPKLLKNMSLINLQLGTSKMGRYKFVKYVLNHENHKNEKNPLLIDVLAKNVEIELLEDVNKREKGQPLTGHKKNKIQLVIDGESYKDLGFRKIEMISTGIYFNVII